MKHTIKAWPHFFAALERGDKNFEVRRDDRNYKIGDLLEIHEYDPSYGHTRRCPPLLFDVTYVLMAEDFPALMPGFVIMGIRPHQ